ncbi:unnamed protein product [Musa acuminata subsp. burmannicoides]
MPLRYVHVPKIHSDARFAFTTLRFVQVIRTCGRLDFHYSGVESLSPFLPSQGTKRWERLQIRPLLFFLSQKGICFGGAAASMAEDLVLDTAIRDWVLVPLSVVMVLIGVLRYFVSKLMRSHQAPDLKVVKEGSVSSSFAHRDHVPFSKLVLLLDVDLASLDLFPRQVILRARNLRAASGFIPAKSFRSRKTYFTNEENGLLHVPKGQSQNAQAQMFSDPNLAMDMMKKNLSMIIPQTLTFAWVNFFFSGFVAAKIPFPLTQRFRGMLQNGIDLSTVDVSYVSSRSWYFLNLFGLRGLFSLILGEENAMDDTQRMMQMSGFGFDPSRSLSAEKDGIDIIQHDWALPKMEKRAEDALKKLLK